MLNLIVLCVDDCIRTFPTVTEFFYIELLCILEDFTEHMISVLELPMVT